jgi:hypothetical protein
LDINDSNGQWNILSSVWKVRRKMVMNTGGAWGRVRTGISGLENFVETKELWDPRGEI